MTSKLRVPVLVVLVALGVVWTSCSTASIERRTLPAALAHHVAALPRFDVAAHVVVPASVAWNAAVAVTRERASIRTLEPGAGLATYYTFADHTESGVRTQSRTWYAVGFAGDARRGLVPNVTAAGDARASTLCGGSSDWQPVAASGADLGAGIVSAIEARANAPLDAFVFEADPLALATQFAADDPSYEATLGVAEDGLPFVEGAMAASSAERRQVVIQVQSRYRVRFVPAEGGARAIVEAYLEHRTVDDEAFGEWQQDDPSRVAEAVYARLATLVPVRDVVLPDEGLDLAVGAEPYEPPLAPPVDDLRGNFAVRVVLAVAPERRVDGSPWDESADAPSPFLPNGPRPLYVPPVTLLDLARRAASSPSPSALDALLDPRGGLASAYGPSGVPSPDLWVSIEGSGGSANTSVVSEALAASWSDAPVALTLAGDAPLTFVLADSDPGAPGERLAAATIQASQLLNACRPICLESDGGMICAALTR